MVSTSPNTSCNSGTKTRLQERLELGHITIDNDGVIHTTALGIHAGLMKFSLLKGNREAWAKYNKGEFDGLFTKYDIAMIEGKRHDLPSM